MDSSFAQLGLRRIALPTGLALLMGTGSPVAQDASVPVSDAQPLLGEWSATLWGAPSSIDIRFDIVDDGGQVVGQVSGLESTRRDTLALRAVRFRSP